MRSLPVVAIAVAAVLLSGCVGAPVERSGGATLAPASDANATNASRAQMPDGRDGSFAAFNETNKTEGGSAGADHRHDLWAGKERVTIAQTNVGLWAAVPPAKGAAGAIALPPKSLVWEGTGTIEVTLSNPQRRACTSAYEQSADGSTKRYCSDFVTNAGRAPDAIGAKLHVWYQDGMSKDLVDAGEATFGKAVVITLKDPRQTDMPHATGTLWRFEVRSADTQDDTLTFDAKIDILRAKGEIPLWPGHPNFYADTHARVVLQKHFTTKEAGVSNLVKPFEPYAYALPEKLVSYGTKTLFVFVNNSKVSADSQPPQSWFLEYYNATGTIRSDGRDGVVGTALSWKIHVGDAGMDSPYAAQSRWGFALRGLYAGCSGCVPYTAEYDITVIASDVALADADYTSQA